MKAGGAGVAAIPNGLGRAGRPPGPPRGAAGSAGGCRSPPRAPERPRAPGPPAGGGSVPPPFNPGERRPAMGPVPRDTGTFAGGRSPSALRPASAVASRVPGPVSGSPSPTAELSLGTGHCPPPGHQSSLEWPVCVPGGDRRPTGSRHGGAGFTWVSSRGDGDGGSTGGLPPQRGGTQRWSLRGPRTPCPAPTALAVRGEDGRRPGRGMLPAAVLRQGRPCYGRAAPKPPSHVLMASSGIVVILLTTAKLAQRKGEPQIAPRFPRSLLLKFGGEVGCQGKAIKCGNNYTRNSYEGSASIFK